MTVTEFIFEDQEALVHRLYLHWMEYMNNYNLVQTDSDGTQMY